MLFIGMLQIFAEILWVLLRMKSTTSVGLIYIYIHIYVFIHPIQLMVFLSCSMYKDNGYFHFLKIVPKYVQISILTVDEYTEMHNN